MRIPATALCLSFLLAAAASVLADAPALSGSPAPAGKPTPDAATYLDPVPFDSGDLLSAGGADSATWRQILPHGGVPFESQGAAAVYDSLRDRLLVYGGTYWQPGCVYPYSHVWRFDFSNLNWSQLDRASDCPGSRSGASMVYDSRRDRLVIFGGGYVDYGFSDHDLNSVWVLPLSGGGGSELAVAGTPPAPRLHHCAIYDPVGDRMIVLGGASFETPFPRDLWVLSFSPTPTWTRIATSLPFGNSIYGTAAYDPHRQRMIVFVGFTDTGSRNETWALSLHDFTWTRLEPTGPLPPARYSQAGAIDAKRDRLLIFGGNGPIGDFWQLSFAEDPPRWSQVAPMGTPSPARAFGVMAFDTRRDRAIIGQGYTPGDYSSSDMWTVEAPTFTVLAEAGANGSIDPTGAVTVSYGDHQTFHMIPDEHYFVSDVVVDGQSVGAVSSYTFDRIVENRTIDVQFGTITYALTVVVHGQGTVTRSPDLPQYFPGTAVQLTAEAAPGWTFARWGGYASGTDSTVTVVMDRNKTVSANFLLKIGFDFKPHDLHLDSKSKKVTGYLRPPAPYLASQIDVGSIRLNGVAVLPDEPAKVEDHDSRLKVKFPRSQVVPTLEAGDNVPVTVTGVIAGEGFVGSDSIEVKAPKMHKPKAHDHLQVGTTVEVAWDPPEGVTSVTLLSSLDDGVTWDVAASNVPNTGDGTWTVPAVVSDQARLAIAAIYEIDETGIVTESEFALSDAFSIGASTGVDGDRAEFALRAANPAIGPLTVRFSLVSEEPATMSVYDVSGRRLVSRQLEGGPGWHTVELGALPTGVYVVRLGQAGRHLSSRVAVIR